MIITSVDKNVEKLGPPPAPHCQWGVNSLAILEKHPGSSSLAKYSYCES